MKISLDRDALLSELQAATRIASTRSAIQALSGVQLDASGSVCEVRATDTDVSLRVPIPAEVTRPGSVLLPARLTLDVVRALPASRMSLEVRSAQSDVEILCGASTFHLRTLHDEDFPPLPQADPASSISLPLAAFVDTISKVSGAASRDETRPVLTGILVSASGKEVRMVATDSYRMSIKETVMEAAISTSFEVNIPARALQELTRLSSHMMDDHLTISVRQNQVIFVIGQLVLSSRLIDGQFPNYRQLLPESFEYEVRMSGPEMREIVSRVSLLAQKNAPLRLSFSPGELTVSAQTFDVGEAREAMAVAFQGEPLEIGFNPEYLRDGLDAIGDSDFTFKLISPLRPGLLQTTDESGFTYLIMPIRLDV
ncbi:MAG: DNA polymerase III subunit beta [Solirubrobacteraceae bacterium]